MQTLKTWPSIVAMLLITSTSTSLLMSNYYEVKIAEAYEQGKQDVDYIELATGNPKLTNKLCHAWWFELDHTSRNLDVQLRKRTK